MPRKNPYEAELNQYIAGFKQRNSDRPSQENSDSRGVKAAVTLYDPSGMPAADPAATMEVYRGYGGDEMMPGFTPKMAEEAALRAYLRAEHLEYFNLIRQIESQAQQKLGYVPEGVSESPIWQNAMRLAERLQQEGQTVPVQRKPTFKNLIKRILLPTGWDPA